MTDFSSLSRRERQIMEILFARGEAAVLEIQGDLPNPPGDMAIRRLLQILEEKGHVLRRRKGRGHVYRPKQAKKRAAKKALQSLLDTFFEGSIDNALATHLARKDTDISDEQFERMLRLIDEARNQREEE